MGIFEEKDAVLRGVALQLEQPLSEAKISGRDYLTFTELEPLFRMVGIEQPTRTAAAAASATASTPTATPTNSEPTARDVEAQFNRAHGSQGWNLQIGGDR